MLYGADLAKRDIAQRRQAVIVEGYTDVMACHLSGITTAVATSGTSFGEGHIKILRRLLIDADWDRGEVIFTFDGDAAGRRAALRAFEMEERFVSQTFVAVQPDGLDPCDLRLKRGDSAVRELIAARVPLYEFAISSTVDEYKHRSVRPNTAQGLLAALDAAAALIARIKDEGRRKVYAGLVDRWLGLMDQDLILARIAEHLPRGQRSGARARRPASPPASGPGRDDGRTGRPGSAGQRSPARSEGAARRSGATRLRRQRSGDPGGAPGAQAGRAATRAVRSRLRRAGGGRASPLRCTPRVRADRRLRRCRRGRRRRGSGSSGSGRPRRTTGRASS